MPEEVKDGIPEDELNEMNEGGQPESKGQAFEGGESEEENPAEGNGLPNQPATGAPQMSSQPIETP